MQLDSDQPLCPVVPLYWYMEVDTSSMATPDTMGYVEGVGVVRSEGLDMQVKVNFGQPFDERAELSLSAGRGRVSPCWDSA